MMELQKIETLLLQELEEVKGGSDPEGTCECDSGAEQSSLPGGTCICKSGAAQQSGNGGGSDILVCLCDSGAVQF